MRVSLATHTAVSVTSH